MCRQQFVTAPSWYKQVTGRLRKAKRQRVTDATATLTEWHARLHPHFFRAPTDNDKGFGNWIAKDWKSQGLDLMRDNVLEPLSVVALPDGGARGTATHLCATTDGGVITHYELTLHPDGSIDLLATFTPEGSLPPLPCLGITLMLPKNLTNLAYFGRGSMDNYPDRHAASTIGLWHSTVSEQYFHYPRPQDSGNHDDTAYLELTDAKGCGWRVSCIDSPFSFSVLPYSVEQIYTTTHDCDLVEDAEHIFPHLDAAVMGLGNSSCGPGVLKKYAVPQQPHTLHVKLERIEN